MRKFIYAFDPEEKEELERRGYKLVQSDDERGVYVFLNSGTLSFSEENAGRFALGDTLWL